MCLAWHAACGPPAALAATHACFLVQENVPQVRPSKPGSVSAAELLALADGLRRQSPAAAHRHAVLLQLAEAAAAALEGPHAGELSSGAGVPGACML